ncbi:polycystin-1 [Sinocyclocheilus grahami]|uniref:polycystin-1 n=1 Tax=Sinocyclocheilus grahami TaxID=75366 RepID=UPI0007AC6247|nr:PREDICTED: polycystin-1-like [Sinocyclocheilus grahami]
MAQGPFYDLDTEDSEMKECTSMALASGKWINEQCNKENFVICGKKISVFLPSLESYVAGVPLMSGIYIVSRIQLLPSPPDPGQQMVEIMLFPGLWFSHEGRVLSLDLVTQPSDQLTFARVQILRPYCSPSHHLVPPGCSSLLNPFSCCSVTPMCNTTGGCASGQYWCHLLEICLPVTSPCSPYHSLNGGHVFPLPPRYPATPPFFHLMADMSLTLTPSTEHTHISVIVQDKHITVYPDDILALQHTRRASEFLHCVATTSSSWRQSYLSLHGPEWGGWLEGGLSAQPGQGQWLDELVCDLRVIYEDTMPHFGVSAIPSTSQSNSPIKAESPVTGLQVLYPKLDKDIQMHVAVNVPTLIVIQIISGGNATSYWSDPVSKNGVPFVSSCPAEMPEIEGGCVRASLDMWFSHVYMKLSSQGEHMLNIMASNSLNSQTLSVRVVSHIPVTGLRIQPQGFNRVLVDIPQLFTASVVTGSSVKYTWVIDDLVQFPQTGESYSVVFKKPAEYKLKLIEVKLTADVMTPLADLEVISMPEAIAVNTSTCYTIQVKSDISIGVTIRWDFGDNTASVSHLVSTPLEMEDSYLHRSAKYVYLQDSIHHTFSFPEASKNISFQVSSGSQANYHWTFLLNGVQSSREIGQNVHFTPFTNGSLSVTVETDNGFCSQSLTRRATIQKHMKKVKLFTSDDGAFIDYPITFVAITDGGSNLKFLWDFGDASEGALVTESNRQVHKYNVTGGSHRFWSSQYDLILDATESFDPDSEENDIELFQFQWGYTIENTTAMPSAVSTLHQHIPGNGSILLLPRSALLPDRMYHFTLTLYKSGRQPVSISQLVTVYNTTLLPVTVKCVSCNSLLSFHVRHSHYITLAGHCSSCQDTVQYRWTAENQKGEALTLNEVTTLTGSLWREIVIKPGVLKEGQEYTFTLNVSEPASGLWGSASITLVPNHPPYGGICTLSPDDSLHFLETMVSYSCSEWMDDDSDSAQLIFSLQVAQCENFGPLCPLITLYRGTQSTFSSLVPLGILSTEENLSVIYVLVLVEDSMGASVIAARKNLTVVLRDQCTTEWLRNKSQSELWALRQQGNPQDITQYSVALSSQLNQLASIKAEGLEDRIQIRGNVIQALASLPVSSLQDAALISSALAQSTVVPSEVQCNGCRAKVLKVTEKMIKVIREQTGQADINPTDTGRNILAVLSSTLTADQRQRNNSGLKHVDTSETAVSALGQILELMRSLMLSRMSGEEALSLAVPKITAVGVRGDPTKDLLCTNPLSHCQFHIPSALSSQLKEEKQEVLQILLQMEGEENLFIPAAEPAISTTLAAMEFATPQGQIISITNLTLDTAIQFTLHKKVQETEDERLLWKTFTLPPKGNVNFTVKAMDLRDPQTGLYVALNFSLIPGAGEEASGLVWISVDDQPVHPLSEHTHSEELSLSLSAGTPSLEHTIFLTPIMLCRFFSDDERRWSSDGLSPLSGSSPHTAHCLTHHLTMFGASLFIHPEALLLLPPSEEPVRNVVVGIICGVLLLIYLLVGLIAHKLDHLESLRLSWVPLCGQKGHYKYRVLVKTGWKKGSGTTAHVGISLYGLNKSGSRHLQREGAFQRNSVDDFQVETDANLGEIWKIRIWHDNTGLDPSWYLKHVIVWDIQTDNMFFFLVEDWLSVENEKNSGRGEKVILASCPQELQQFKRILHSQLLFGLREHHLWISLWERPAHSHFSRAQRVTCCALLLHLYLAAGAVWYGAVGRKGSSGPVSTQMVMNAENILVGITVAALMFPLQTILRFLFQNTKSKVTLAVSLPPSPVSHTVEMDVFLSHPDLSCSSFLSLPTDPDSSIYDGPSPFTNSLKKLDSEFWNTPDPGNDRMDQWPSCESIFGLSELTGTSHLLKRKKAILQLHLSTPTSDHNTLEPIKSSEEDLITITADLDPSNTLSLEPEASDSGHFTPNDTILSDIQDSLCSEWSDLSVDTPTSEPGFHKSSSSLSVLSDASTFLPSLPPDSISTISNTRIGVVRGVPGLFLPSWVLRMVYLLVAVLLGTSLALVGLYGSRFSSSVVLMWLVSALSAFLTSALLFEPFAICIQALYLAAVVKPVDPEGENRLAQETEVRRTEEDLGDKVHPLGGYGLLQAKEEARKLRTLRALMRSCLVYLLFLLVVLMVNYQEYVHETNSRRLHSAIKHTLIRTLPGQPSLTALSGTKAVLIEFTHYHKQTGVLAPVSILLDQTQTGRILSFLSIQPLHVSPFSGPDLHVTLTVLLLLFALCFVSAEVWALIRKPSQYLRQAWRWFQPLLALLTLAAAVLRLYFLYTTAAFISRHCSRPSCFADFHSAATLAKKSSQLSAILLTLLVLKMVGILRFVRRWLVIGRVIRQVFPQICGVVFLLLLLLLLFSHTGIMLFSGSVEGFRTLGQASSSLLCLLRGHMGLRRLCEHHPVVGPLYCLSAVGIGFWVLGRLCAAVLIRTYRMVQADIYRPSMEPQDYEMVQFLIKRLKLWMGLSKTKEFRHRVKFEGMVPPPSRSSQGSEASNCSVPLSPIGPRRVSSASSLASNSSVISGCFDFHHYVDRLVPCVDSLMAGFDRVNQLTEEVYNFELQLQQIQSRIYQRRKSQPQQVTFEGRDPTPKLPLLPQHPSTSVLECNHTPASLQGVINTLPHCRATHSESSLMGPAAQLGKRILSALDGSMNNPNLRKWGVPRRRAWNSVTCHSADTAQRLPGSHSTVTLPVRPRSEDGDREYLCDSMPIKRQAWHTE